jgi:muramoyltetrapeptide carboxypeptidase
MNRYGSLGGADKDRAADINRFFGDRDIAAVIPTRGGWGSARLLPHLDFDVIRRNPKIILGYSDITALLNSIHARTGLVTFHGPNGGGRWDSYSLDWTRRVLFAARPSPSAIRRRRTTATCSRRSTIASARSRQAGRGAACSAAT